MGFLKNLIYIFLTGTLLFSCSKQLVLDDLNFKNDGHLMFGRTNERTFYHPFNMGDSLILKWNTDTKGSYKKTSMIFLDKYMFVADLAGSVYGFELDKGKELGQEKNKGAINIAPVIHNSKMVYVVEELKEPYSTIYFYEYYNGDYTNEHIIPGSCSNELIKIDDTVFLLSDNGILYKYTLYGFKKWDLDLDAEIKCTPALSNNKIIVGSLSGEIISIDIENKKIVYRNKLTRSIQSGVTINDGKGYIGDEDGNVICFNIETGEQIWKFETGAKITSIPVMNNENLFVGNLDGGIFSLNKNSGKLIWENSTGGIINTTPLLFDDYLVQPDLFKKIYFVDVESGEIAKQIDVDGRMKMSPVYFNNTIYFGMDKGEILAYEVIGVEE
jgi:outer membrane protein assembly factor BamB